MDSKHARWVLGILVPLFIQCCKVTYLLTYYYYYDFVLLMAVKKVKTSAFVKIHYLRADTV